MRLGDLLANYLRLEAQQDYAPLLACKVGQLINHHAALHTLHADKMTVTQGSIVYFAVQGGKKHGLQYLSSEDLKKIDVLVYQQDSQDGITHSVLSDLPAWFSSVENAHKLIPVSNLAERLSEIGGRFYGQVSQQTPVIGVTGTNGKSSIAQFIAQLSDGCSIGTVGYGYQSLTPLEHTTPDALYVQKILAELHENYPQKSIAMEVSSHALMQARVKAIHFSAVVFSNLSQDHLDFHGTMTAYFVAKSRLFTEYGAAQAIINVDDVYGQQLVQQLAENSQIYGMQTVWAYGQSNVVKSAHHYAHFTNVKLSPRGAEFDLSLSIAGQQWQARVVSPLWGEFNIYNALASLLAVLAVSVQSGVRLDEEVPVLLDKLRSLQAVRGRLSPITLNSGATAIIDFAHTPDALRSALQAIRGQIAVDGRIICVFGCGGDRDKDKRPKMAMMAAQFADQVIVTDDNPRTEHAMAIIDDILQAPLSDEQRIRFQAVSGRREAIVQGLQIARAGDVVLIAGKGHETYQIIGETRHHFSDFDEVVAYETAQQNTTSNDSNQTGASCCH